MGAHGVDDAVGGAQARAHAARLLLDARGQARELLAAAAARAEEERREAVEHGYAEGVLRARAEQAAGLERLAELARGAASAHVESMRNLDRTVVLLVLELVRTVVKHEASVAPQTILQVVRAAMDELSLETAVAVRVHPDDVALLEAGLAGIGVPAGVAIAVQADPALSRGGCVLESGAGRVDATMETQLQRIESLFHEQLHADGE